MAAELNRLATSATNHCLIGCVLGEVTGMAIATALGWGDVASIALAVALASLFGYTLTSLPLNRAARAQRLCNSLLQSLAVLGRRPGRCRL